MATEVEEILATLGLETQEEKDQLQAILNELVPAGKELSVKQKEEDPPPVGETKADEDDDEEEVLEEEVPREEAEEEEKAEPKGGLVGTISEKLQALCTKLEGAERESLGEILLLVSSLGQEKQIEPSLAVAEAINDRLAGLDSLGERVSKVEGLESRILALEAAGHEVKDLEEKIVSLEKQIGGLGSIQQFLSSRPKAATRPSQEVAALDPASELVKQVEKDAREVQGVSGPLSGFIGYRGSDSD